MIDVDLICKLNKLEKLITGLNGEMINIKLIVKLKEVRELINQQVNDLLLES